MTPKRPATRLDFEIAIICALVIEADAVRGLFDRDWDDDGPPYDKAPGDSNAYSAGLLGRHNVVLAYMPGMGKAKAANVASNCRTSFPNIRLALVVGVCGVVPHVPDTKDEIVLGDVIMSSGVIQYDLGRWLPEQFVRKNTLLDSLGRPNAEILTLLAKLGSIHDRKRLRDKLAGHLEVLQEEPELKAEYPGIAHDKLFNATYRHISDGKTCEECGCNGDLIRRHRLDQGIPKPVVHAGLIASGDTVMKSGERRDNIARDEGIIGFEMEGAGMWDTFPCLVIKGACDYADSHKTKVWQRYASATAAACTKAFLEYWVPSVTKSHIQCEYTLAFSLSEVADVDRFVGRKDELAQMHNILDKPDGRRIAVLHGLGGIGKTQLAIAYLKTYHSNYSATIWLNASDEISLQQSFHEIAEKIIREYPAAIAIRTAMESRDPYDIIQAVKRWLDEPNNDRWLLVFDNYDNPRLEKERQVENDEENTKHSSDGHPKQEATLASKAYDVRTFFPNNYQGAIIITTRSSTVRFSKPISLKRFTRVNESLEVLQSHSQRDKIEQDDAAIELVQRLEGLPLALATAGAYLSQVSISYAEYLKQYQESWLRLQKKTPGLLSYENRAMYSTWDITYKQIKHRNHAAAMMLHLWADFDKEDLWYEMLRYEGSEVPLWFKDMVQDRISFDEVMRVLCSHGLVETDQKEWGVDSRGYSVHECVHAWMKYALNAEQDISMAHLAMSCIASRIPDKDEANYFLVQRRLLLHVDICSSRLIELVQLDDIDCGSITHRFGSLYADQCRYAKAEAMYNRSLQGREKAWGPEHTSTLDTVNDLGLLYADQGRYSEAEAMYNRALQGNEKAWGPEHVWTLDIVNNLGILYVEQGRYSEAAAMYNRALQGREKAWGPEHTSTLEIVNNLGILYVEQGKYSEAESMYNRALQGKEKAWGPEHASTLNTVNNLGVLYKAQGRYIEAEAIYNRALQGKEKAWGPEHTSTLNTVNNLGLLYVEQGRYSEAEAVCNRALQGREKAWGPEHTSTLDTVNNLGLLYKAQGLYSEAEAMYNRALQGKEKTWGPEHISTLDTVNHIGALYVEQGRYGEAEAMYNRALQGYQQALGTDADTYPLALNTLKNLGHLFYQLNKLGEAENHYARAQSGLATIYGHNSDQYREVSSQLSKIRDMQQPKPRWWQALARLIPYR
ncbi:hypothetical protein BGZ63DRAFT_488662 [Mariannaea sp. PMI_226]|nr:hypothetical protein BGZ63DRAFT_488662 [Mariannaea sp. PMI_226]